MERLWDRQFGELCHLARLRLRSLGISDRTEVPEGLAAGVLGDFILAAPKGAYPTVDTRSKLQALFHVMVKRRAASILRRNRTKKRGRGKVRGESGFARDGADPAGGGLENQTRPYHGRQEDFEDEQALADAIQDDLELDGPLLEILLLKLQKYSNAEIASRIDCAICTVERKLDTIREVWERRSLADWIEELSRGTTSFPSARPTVEDCASIVVDSAAASRLADHVANTFDEAARRMAEAMTSWPNGVQLSSFKRSDLERKPVPRIPEPFYRTRNTYRHDVRLWLIREIPRVSSPKAETWETWVFVDRRWV
ncbi:MAG TPA: ECF-type sigma factor, partial [Pirellulaceae bacterium]